jgi:predicted RecB family nuclease
MAERLLTPSKITAWLDCAHFLTLQHKVDGGTLTVNPPPFGSFAQLLVDKGLQHEADCLAEYRRRGGSIYEVPARRASESFAAWVDRIGDPFESGYDVIYQMPFIHDGVRGIADFLIRVENPDPGGCTYEPVDAKLARSEGKPGHVLQLCFYADALQGATGLTPKHVHLWLGSGHMESLLLEQFRPYWNRLRSQLTVLLDDNSVDAETHPEPCAYCDFCEFNENCSSEWRDSDSLIYVAGIRGVDRNGLESSGVETLGQLAVLNRPVDAIQPERLTRLIDQASLQAQARTDADRPPPSRIIEPSADPTWGRGFELIPEPNEGDLFLDFEGDPFWHADVGLFFLFGLIIRRGTEDWEFRAFWAHDRDEEAAATRELIEFITVRRELYPAMHVYHYNHTERSALERLTADHGVGEAALATLIETGLFIDLYPIVRNAVQVGTESYGLKSLERLTGYERGHDIEQGSAAVVEYEKYMVDRDSERLTRIAAYNEDDVRSTLALRDWLVAHRPEGLEWRVSSFEPEEGIPELDAQVAALHAFGPDTSQHLLGDLLGYWLRERRANKAPKLAKAELDTPTLLDDPDVIAGLIYLGPVERIGKNGRQLQPGVRFGWPEQSIGEDVGTGRSSSVLYSTPAGPTGYAAIDRIDREQRELDVTWSTRSQELGVTPSVVVLDDWVSPKPKPAALSDLAAKILDPSSMGAPNDVSIALLRRDLPVFNVGKAPAGGEFTDELEAITQWVPHLDHSYVAIQGPPGTGKTFRGAHIVHRLICAGQRVGITAMSHHAIDNLLAEIVRVFEEKGDAGKLKCIRRVPQSLQSSLPGVEYATSNVPCARGAFNLIAGTTWLFSGNDMKDAPVDVLIIDEAGQLALADAVAASRSAQNLIVLGDPLQLPQVAQASHPGGGGRSVLEHVLGEDVTIPPDRGVFLAETWRMHPDVCRFISEQIYAGRLSSHPTCAIQSTEFGTGLRWLKAEHANRSTESMEEAEIVAEEIRRLVGSKWVNQRGEESRLTVTDFMVVAPYNDQVNLLRAHLDADRRTRGVPVGSVDKFQGREAPVVFFTMTTSSAEDMPRGPDFLFSRNRLNVAISRARCLAYLVCTPELLNSRARDIEEMRLISTLCAFGEYAIP